MRPQQRFASFADQRRAGLMVLQQESLIAQSIVPSSSSSAMQPKQPLGDSTSAMSYGFAVGAQTVVSSIHYLLPST